MGCSDVYGVLSENMPLKDTHYVLLGVVCSVFYWDLGLHTMWNMTCIFHQVWPICPQVWHISLYQALFNCDSARYISLANCGVTCICIIMCFIAFAIMITYCLSGTV